jgi:hypothetical protein
VEQIRQRAVTAQQLLENQVLRDAFADVEAEIVEQMRRCPLDDKDAHQRLVMALQMSQAVNRKLWLAIQDGVAATESLKLRGRRID